MCQCGKVEYSSKNDAWAAKVQMQKKYHKNQIYMCGICHSYHLGRDWNR